MWRGASFLIAFCFEVLRIFFKSRSAAQNQRRKYIKPRVSLKIGTRGFLMFTIFKTFCWVIFLGFYIILSLIKIYSVMLRQKFPAVEYFIKKLSKISV